jgi:hypothetical protein
MVSVTSLHGHDHSLPPSKKGSLPHTKAVHRRTGQVPVRRRKLSLKRCRHARLAPRPPRKEPPPPGKRFQQRLGVDLQNCNGLKTDDRVEEALLEMHRRNVDMLCLAETWRRGEETFEHDDVGATLLFNGLKKEDQTRRGSNGVGFVLGENSARAWRAPGSKHLEASSRVAVLTFTRRVKVKSATAQPTVSENVTAVVGCSPHAARRSTHLNFPSSSSSCCDCVSDNSTHADLEITASSLPAALE